MKFKSDIEVQAGLRDGSDDIGTAGQLLSSTGTITNWIDQSEVVAAGATTVLIACKNTSGATITKGTPVYQTGNVGATAVIEIDEADALISTGYLPAIGLLETDLINNAFGHVVITGELLNITTSPIDGVTPVTGDTIYLKSGGGLTLTKPTGEGNAIQNLGLVGKVSVGNAGSLTVASIMRQNDVPNLPEGRIWIGDGNTIVSDTVYVDEPNNRVGIGTTGPNAKLDVYGGLHLGTTGDFNITQSSFSTTQFFVTGGGNGGTITFGAPAGITQNVSVQGDLYSFQGSIGTKQFGIQNNKISYNGDNYLNSGNLGIGTTSPSDKLVVKNGTSSTDVKILAFNNAAGTEATLKFSTIASETNYEKASIIARNAAASFGRSDMHFALDSVADSGNVQFSDTKMTILNGGNVGIGTTSPDTKLEVSSLSGGVLRLTSTDTSVATGESIGRVEFKSNDASTGGNNVMGFVDCLATNAGSTYALTFGTGNAAAATEKMRINQSGNVGIGTTSLTSISSTSTTLSLGATSATTSGGIAFQVSGGVVKAYNYVASNYLINQTVAGIGQIFYGAGSEQMRIHNTTGNVGIGTTSPSYKLDVSGTGRFTDILTSDKLLQIPIAGTTINEGKGVGLSLTDDFPYVGNDSTTRYLNHYGMGIHKPLQASIAGGNGAYLSGYFGVDIFTAGISRIHVNQNGNVGIGTTSPSTVLEVSSSGVNGVDISQSASNASQSGRLFFTTNTASEGFALFNSNGTFQVNSGGIPNNTSGTNRISIIGSSGKVGIGTTNPTRKLHVLGPGNSTPSDAGGIFLQTSGGGGLDIYATSTAANPVFDFRTFSGEEISFSPNSTELMRLKGSNVGIGTTSPSFQLQLSTNSAAKPSSNVWTVTSDSRVKENIRDYTTGLEAILKIEPKLYDYNGKAGFEKTKNNIGIIAQDIQKVMPETVNAYNTKLNEDDAEDTELLNFDGHAVTFALINAVKDLKAEIEELKKQINK